MTFPPLAFWAFSGLFGALFVLMEVVKRRTQIRGTVTRKILHVSTALISMALPSYLTPGWLLVLAGVFTGVLALSKAFKVFTSIHEVPRKTWGEVVFPLGIGLASWLVYYGLGFGARTRHPRPALRLAHHGHPRRGRGMVADKFRRPNSGSASPWRAASVSLPSVSFFVLRTEFRSASPRWPRCSV